MKVSEHLSNSELHPAIPANSALPSPTALSPSISSPQFNHAPPLQHPSLSLSSISVRNLLPQLLVDEEIKGENGKIRRFSEVETPQSASMAAIAGKGRSHSDAVLTTGNTGPALAPKSSSGFMKRTSYSADNTPSQSPPGTPPRSPRGTRLTPPLSQLGSMVTNASELTVASPSSSPGPSPRASPLPRRSSKPPPYVPAEVNDAKPPLSPSLRPKAPPSPSPSPRAASVAIESPQPQPEPSKPPTPDTVAPESVHIDLPQEKADSPHSKLARAKMTSLGLTTSSTTSTTTTAAPMMDPPDITIISPRPSSAPASLPVTTNNSPPLYTASPINNPSQALFNTIYHYYTTHSPPSSPAQDTKLRLSDESPAAKAATTEKTNRRRSDEVSQPGVRRSVDFSTLLASEFAGISMESPSGVSIGGSLRGRDNRLSVDFTRLAQLSQLAGEGMGHMGPGGMGALLPGPGDNAGRSKEPSKSLKLNVQTAVSPRNFREISFRSTFFFFFFLETILRFYLG